MASDLFCYAAACSTINSGDLELATSVSWPPCGKFPANNSCHLRFAAPRTITGASHWVRSIDLAAFGSRPDDTGRPAAHRFQGVDIGTGSGYQAAILSLLVDHVYSIEIVEPLATAARDRLARLGYNNVTVRHGDGRRGWPEQMPFDLILGAAAPLAIPPALIDQLAPGGRLTMPVGPASGQRLMLVEKRADGSIHEQAITPVSFVPMTGDDQA